MSSSLMATLEELKFSRRIIPQFNRLIRLAIHGNLADDLGADDVQSIHQVDNDLASMIALILTHFD